MVFNGRRNVLKYQLISMSRALRVQARHGRPQAYSGVLRAITAPPRPAGTQGRAASGHGSQGAASFRETVGLCGARTTIRPFL